MQIKSFIVIPLTAILQSYDQQSVLVKQTKLRH